MGLTQTGMSCPVAMERERLLLRANAPAYRPRARSTSRPSKERLPSATFAQRSQLISVQACDVGRHVAYEASGPSMRERKRDMRTANSKIRALTPPPRVTAGRYQKALWRYSAQNELQKVKTLYDACDGASGNGLTAWQHTLSPGHRLATKSLWLYNKNAELEISDVAVVGRHRVLLPGHKKPVWLFSPGDDFFGAFSHRHTILSSDDASPLASKAPRCKATSCAQR